MPAMISAFHTATTSSPLHSNQHNITFQRNSAGKNDEEQPNSSISSLSLQGEERKRNSAVPTHGFPLKNYLSDCVVYISPSLLFVNSVRRSCFFESQFFLHFLSSRGGDLWETAIMRQIPFSYKNILES